MEPAQLHGTAVVKQWSDNDGWGVVTIDGDGLDVWAHFSMVDMPGYRHLVPGRRVTCDYEMVEQDGYAARAVSVVPLD